MQQLFYCPDVAAGLLPEEEAKHCLVLRKQVGQTIDVTDGLGNFYKAQLTEVHPKKGCSFSITEVISTAAQNHFIHLAIAPTKNADRMEWLVEKCVEVGIQKISFIETSRTERTKLRLDRLEKIAVSAMKQSLQSRLPILQGLISFEQLVLQSQEQQRFIAYINEKLPFQHLSKLALPQQSYCVLIGPEGDFMPQEVALATSHQFECVSLGNNRLRTETAGLYAVSILSFLNV
jgi:16S rRNA (uracil1498-N3)-methyltransferase